MRLRKLLFSRIILTFSILFLLGSTMASAESYSFSENSGLKQSSSEAGYEIASSTSLTGYISQVISIILSVLGIAFLCLTIYGGIIWMTAAGNEEKVTKAKEIIIESVIGVIIVIAAYAISYFILSATTTASIKTNTSTTTQVN